jgi:hypothetical protein
MLALTPTHPRLGLEGGGRRVTRIRTENGWIPCSPCGNAPACDWLISRMNHLVLVDTYRPFKMASIHQVTTSSSPRQEAFLLFSHHLQS